MGHIDRIRDEKTKLDADMEKLRAFIWDGNPTFEALPLVDVDLLLTQHHCMRQLSEILGKRLARS